MVAALHGLGWTDSPHAWIKPMLTATVDHDGATFPVPAYVLDAAHELRRGLLATRDALRADPRGAARYTAVKRAAITAGHASPWAYQQAETPYLQQLAARAVDDAPAPVRDDDAAAAGAAIGAPVPVRAAAGRRSMLSLPMLRSAVI